MKKTRICRSWMVTGIIVIAYALMIGIGIRQVGYRVSSEVTREVRAMLGNDTYLRAW